MMPRVAQVQKVPPYFKPHCRDADVIEYQIITIILLLKNKQEDYYI